ncbi:MAG TPA: hypothetical protein PLO65_07925 [Caulobacter sp.]|nr:hypothetical protein [Caulobacter sp.]
MSKYAPLTTHLASLGVAEAPMTFAEIEAVTGHALPASKRYPAWWSNNPSNNVMTRAWLAAGYQTERVDIAGERLVFRRISAASGAWPEVTPSAPVRDGTLLERIRARLGGTVTITPGADLTAPAGEIWDAER